MASQDEYEKPSLAPSRLTDPKYASSSPIYPAFCHASSDGVEVPTSSSPTKDGSSPSETSVVSYECAYSASEADSCAATEPASPNYPPPHQKTEFTESLTERLLLVAAEREPSSERLGLTGSHGNKPGSSGERTPRHSYRVIKRSYSHSSSPKDVPRGKYRRLSQDQGYVVTDPTTPVQAYNTAVPTIAPPAYYVPRLPLSAETEAKIRLGKFLEREAKEKIRDGLLDGPEPSGSRRSQSPLALAKPRQWEIFLGIGRNLRETVIDWLTGVLPKHASGRYSESAGSESSSNSSFDSTSSTTSCEASNLYDQLASCPETRFHAVWMFLRYSWLESSVNDSASPVYPSPSTSLVVEVSKQNDEFTLAVWDTALACLALSVKFHRDFLVPLYPVQARDFIELAHRDISYEDFEATQRDILKALSYSVGVSPQAILDELWAALPSLRQVFSFDGGWNALQKEVWFRLYEIIYAPDVLRFAQSCLVAIALIDSLIPCLTTRYEYQAAWHAKAIQGRTGPNRARGKDLANSRQRFMKRATEDAEGVIFDIQAVVGISDVQLAEGRTWWFEATSRLNDSPL